MTGTAISTAPPDNEALLKTGAQLQKALKSGELDRARTLTAGLSRLLHKRDALLDTLRAAHASMALIGPVVTMKHSRASGSNDPQLYSIGTPRDLGLLVKRARKELGMTQQRFADLAGIGRRFVSELEAGKPSMEFGKVMEACKAIGIDLQATRR
jgi:y4mF family transcriptional regulator